MSILNIYSPPFVCVKGLAHTSNCLFVNLYFCGLFKSIVIAVTSTVSMSLRADVGRFQRPCPVEDHLYASVNSYSRSVCVLKVDSFIDRLCRASYFKRRESILVFKCC